MEISKNQIKLINSLRLKKNRSKHGLFVAEGVKVVREFLDSTYELEQLFVIENKRSFFENDNCTVVSELSLKKVSSLKTPSGVLAIFKIPAPTLMDYGGLEVALDNINDPGNLGTIIRLCDWFGVKRLVCSKDTVDCYNAKVVQATMGSLTRVDIVYLDLVSYLQDTVKTVFSADMAGENIYDTDLPAVGVIVMGNEANGISTKVQSKSNRTIAIPQFGALKATESLNVATATSIVLSEFKRRTV